MAAHGSLVVDERVVLGQVQEGDGVEVGTEPQDFAALLAQPVERRAGPVVVVPGGLFEQADRAGPTSAEPTVGMVVHDGARALTEHLGQDADIGIGGRRVGVESRCIREEASAFRFGVGR